MIDIEAMAVETSGMLEPSTYRVLHELAQGLCDGDILDIGVGQGATTIAYATGLQNSGQNGQIHVVDQFFQHKRGPHRYSLASNPEDAVERNVAVFLNHLEQYGVSKRVNVFIGTTNQAGKAKLPIDRLGLLSIDVDGNIDRDLGLFGDLVSPGGLIVIDDYHNSVNHHGRSNIAHQHGKSESDIREWAEALHISKRRQLLGKHLLTFRLADAYAEAGFMRLEKVVGRSTGVFIRSGQTAAFNEFHPMVDCSIVNDFVSFCVASNMKEMD